MKKNRISLLVLLLIGSVLVGTAGPVAARKVTLEVWGLDPEDQGYGALIDYWNKNNPDIQVNAIAAGMRIQDPQKLLTAIAAGAGPDVAWVDRFQIASWVARNAFQPLDDLAAANDFVAEDVFYEPALDEATYLGSLWALPTTTDSRALYLNIDLLDDAGLSADDLDTGNWEQLTEYAVKLTRRDSSGRVTQIGFVPTQDPWTLGSGGMWLWGWANGGREVDEEGNVALDNPQFVEALEWAVDVIDKCGGMVEVADFASGFGPGAQEGFIQGKIAIRLNHNEFLRDIARYRPDLNFTVLPIKYRNSNNLLSFGGGHSLVIPRGTDKLKEAWAFMEWFTSAEAWVLHAQAWKAYFESEGRPWIPTFSANKLANELVLRQVFQPQEEKWLHFVRIFEELLNYNRFRAQSPVGHQIHQAFLFEAQQEAQYHVKTAEQALRDATVKCQQELEEFLRHQ